MWQSQPFSENQRFAAALDAHPRLVAVGYASNALGAIEYLQWVGLKFGADYEEKYARHFSGRRRQLKQAMAAIRAYEYGLSRAVLAALEGIPGLRLYGLSDVRRLEERVPTFSFRLEGWHPRHLAEKLAEQEIYVWDGNYYALAVTERLGVEAQGGMLRVGPVHYNTLEEVGRLQEALEQI